MKKVFENKVKTDTMKVSVSTGFRSGIGSNTISTSRLGLGRVGSKVNEGSGAFLKDIEYIKYEQRESEKIKKMQEYQEQIEIQQKKKEQILIEIQNNNNKNEIKKVKNEEKNELKNIYKKEFVDNKIDKDLCRIKNINSEFKVGKKEENKRLTTVARLQKKIGSNEQITMQINQMSNQNKMVFGGILKDKEALLVLKSLNYVIEQISKGHHALLILKSGDNYLRSFGTLTQSSINNIFPLINPSLNPKVRELMYSNYREKLKKNYEKYKFELYDKPNEPNNNLTMEEKRYYSITYEIMKYVNLDFCGYMHEPSKTFEELSVFIKQCTHEEQQNQESYKLDLKSNKSIGKSYDPTRKINDEQELKQVLDKGNREYNNKLDETVCMNAIVYLFDVKPSTIKTDNAFTPNSGEIKYKNKMLDAVPIEKQEQINNDLLELAPIIVNITTFE